MKTIVANWKMNLSLSESYSLTRQVIQIAKKIIRLPEVILCPAAVALCELKKILSDSFVKLGAQACAGEVKGAYTGEIAAAMLKEAGCTHVLIGHSERRLYCCQSLEQVRAEYSQALQVRLLPILCVGESVADRAAGNEENIVSEQLKTALADMVDPPTRLLIAYEPLWAIGEKKSASISQMLEMHTFIRSFVLNLVNVDKI